MTAKARNIAYWTTTGLVAFFIGSGSVSQVVQYAGNRARHRASPWLPDVLLRDPWEFGRRLELLPYWLRAFHGSKNGLTPASSLI